MKTWVAVYLLGKLVATAGPLPITLADCERHLARAVVSDRAVRVACEQHEERPPL